MTRMGVQAQASPHGNRPVPGAVAGFTLALAGSTVLGLLAGLIWGEAAPRAMLQEIGTGTAQLVNAETSAFIGADAWFVGISVVAGLLTGLAGYRFLMTRAGQLARIATTVGLVLGALAAALVARGVAERATDAAYGVLYIAPAALCLVWLRSTNQGHWWTLMLFASTWAADIGAFAVGSLLKGPKLWPRFSPNKTWSGFMGGLAAASATGAVMAGLSVFRLDLRAAALVGFTVGLATMAGDLWESALKRRFGVKDSGDLIPGHGGLLDRVDGLMFAVVVMAAARLANHLGWGH